jgi:D-alanyl-D-alanine carboxypeptidase
VAGSTTKYEAVEILAKSTDPLSMVLDLTPIMKEYEKYLDPADRDGYLVLSNKNNPLSSDYAPDDLVDLKTLGTYETPLTTSATSPTNTQMRLYAAKALEAMILQLRAEEYMNIFAQSGYRTYATQESLFNGYIDKEMAKDPSLSREEAEAIVLTYSAKPGTSEHQTGLCIDLVDDRLSRFTPLENPFTTELGMKWLAENAWKFGFILRYDQGKEDITGYSYESWHFRYVGRYHAERITALDITLEEYLEDYYGK